MNDRYEQYERKVRRAGAAVRRGRGFIRMHRAVILTVIAVLAVLGAAALATAGLIVGETTCAATAYGAPPKAQTFVILGKARYEYASADSEDWAAALPREPGEYRLRAVTSRPFGGSDRGEPVAFTLRQREITVRPDEDDSWMWGDEPTPFCGLLVPGDELIRADFSVTQQIGVHAVFTVIPHTVVIRDADGQDVTGSYAVAAEPCRVTYEPRPVTITFPNEEVTYSGRPISVPYGRLTDGSLAAGDRITASAELTVRRAGTQRVDPIIQISAPDGSDVTVCYDITIAGGEITVHPYQDTVTTGSAAKTYDGTPLRDATYRVSHADKWPEGHVLDIQKSVSLTDAGSIRNEVTSWRVRNAAGEDVTECFDIIWKPGTLRVAPRPVTIAVKGYTCYWDGTCHTAECYLQSGGLAGCDFYADDVSGLTDVGVIASPTVTDWHIVRVSDMMEIPKKNFDVTITATAPLEVKPLELRVASGSDAKVYDGTPLDGMAAGFSLLPDSMPIPAGYILKPGAAAKLTKVGSLPNDMSGWRLLRLEDGRAVNEKNFRVTVEPGTLIMTAAATYLTGDSQTVDYDGLFHDGTESARLSEPFGDFTVLLDGGVNYRVPGTYPVRPDMKTVRVLDTEGRDVTACFGTISVDKDWTLTIAPRPVTVTTASAVFDYDGRPHNAASASVGTGGLVDGHLLVPITFSTALHAGTVPNELLSFRIMDGKRDVTDFYNVTVLPGELTVKPRTIAVLTESAEKTYDGTPLSCGTAAFPGDPARDLLPGHELTIISMIAVTRAGIYDNVPGEYSVIDRATGEDVSADYAFSANGRLTVYARMIRAVTDSAEKPYDAKPLTALSVSHSGLAAGDTMTFDTGSISYQLTPGQKENRLLPVIRNRQGEDVTDCYFIEMEYGTLTVTPRPLSLRVTADRLYDGYSFDIGDLHAAGAQAGMLLPGHTVRLDRVNMDRLYESFNAGHYPAADYVFGATVWAGDRDVTSCYSIQAVTGDLVIRKRQITIRCDGMKQYDGLPLTSNVPYIGGDGLAEGQWFSNITTEGSQTELGRSPNVITSYAIRDRSRDVTENYDVTCLEGRLTVTCLPENDPRPVLVVNGSEQTKVYDGSPIDTASLLLWVSGSLPAGYTVRADEIRVLSEDDILVEERNADPTYGTASVGSYTVVVTQATVLDAAGNDVTNDYRILYGTAARVTVLPRRLTLLSGSAAKMDDGQPLVCKDVTVISGELASGDSLDLLVTGCQSGIGESANTFTCTVINASGEDVTANYELTLINGTLMIQE